MNLDWMECKMDFLFSIFNILLLSFLEVFYLLGVLMAVGLVLGILEKYSNSYLVQAFGPRGILVTAWIGTPIHEAGHLIQCFIWGHRVTKVKLLQLDSPNGVLGYVEHSYNRNSIYQQVGNFFIGMGPIFSGIGSLILIMYLLVPQSFTTFQDQIQQYITVERLDLTVLKTIAGAVFVICKSLFTLVNLINPQFWIFLLIAISISSHIALSKADIKGSAKGLLMIFAMLVLFNLITGFLHLESYQLIMKMAEYNAYVLAFSSISLLFSFITLVLSFIFYKIRS